MSGLPATPDHPALKIHLLRPELAVVPRYATEHAAGLDLHAALERELAIAPGERVAVPTGLALAIPAGYEGQVRARSGLARKFGIALVNAPGTIDADYRGEVQVLLINLGRESYRIQPKDRIAQLVIAPIARVQLETVDDVAELGSTDRGHGGFGSTGR
jgi:dUTP pyrophosphatase